MKNQTEERIAMVECVAELARLADQASDFAASAIQAELDAEPHELAELAGWSNEACSDAELASKRWIKASERLAEAELEWRV